MDEKIVTVEKGTEVFKAKFNPDSSVEVTPEIVEDFVNMPDPDPVYGKLAYFKKEGVKLRGDETEEELKEIASRLIDAKLKEGDEPKKETKILQFKPR